MLNTAGQGTEWAHALTRFTNATAESWAITRPQEQVIQFAADRTHPLINGAADQAWLDLLNPQSKPTHLIIESGKPISIKGTVRRMLFQAVTARRHGIRQHSCFMAATFACQACTAPHTLNLHFINLMMDSRRSSNGRQTRCAAG